MITGSVQINKSYYFLVFNMYDEAGKRKPEWHSTGLKVDSNERKNNQIRKQAEKMLNEELVRINAENSFSNKILVLDNVQKCFSKHFLNYNTLAQVLGKMLGKSAFFKIKTSSIILRIT